MADKKKNLAVRLLNTPVGTANFVNVFEPRPFEPGDPPKYSVVLTIDKKAAPSTALAEMKKAVQAVAMDRWGKDAPAMLLNGQLRNPIRDGDAPGSHESLKGKIYFRASEDADHKPPVFDELGKTQLVGDEDFFSGCTARLKVDVWSYEAKGNKGVGLSLRAVQRVGVGERLDGRTKVESFEEAPGAAVDPLA
jgi:hypothetical protein